MEHIKKAASQLQTASNNSGEWREVPLRSILDSIVKLLCENFKGIYLVDWYVTPLIFSFLSPRNSFLHFKTINVISKYPFTFSDLARNFRQSHRAEALSNFKFLKEFEWVNVI